MSCFKKVLLLLAIIGLACGAGYVECAVFATLVVLVVELLSLIHI